MNLKAKPYGNEIIKANYDKILKNCLSHTCNCLDCPLNDYIDCKGILSNAIIGKIQEDESTIKRQREQIIKLCVIEDKYYQLCDSINIIREITQDDWD